MSADAFDLACREIVVSHHDRYLAALHGIANDLAVGAEKCGARARIRFDSTTNRRGIGTPMIEAYERLADALDKRDKTRTAGIGRIERGANGAALLVTEDHDQLCVTVRNGVFDAGQIKRPGDVACHPNDEELVDGTVEDELRRNAAVGARQDGDRRVLMVRGVVPLLREIVEFQVSGDERAVSFHERIPEDVGTLRERRKSAEQKHDDQITALVSHSLSIAESESA
jgi:hypothetical protein